MKAFRISRFALVIVLGIVLLSNSVALAKESNPETIYRAAYDAFNAGDMDAAMEFFADDLVAVLMPPPPGTDVVTFGKEAFSESMGGAVEGDMQWELSGFHINGETASYNVSVATDDFLTDYNVYPLEFTGFVVIRDGLILSEVWAMEASSLARLESALAEISREETVRRYMEELWNEGNLSVADEVLSQDFVSHNSPAGDREALKQSVTDFHAENPGAYFSIDNLAMSDDQAIVVTTMWVVAEDAEEGDEGEPVSEPMVLTLGLKDGKITDRQLFMTAEE
ncbi:MAG: nuclear transport factor 2 family protein [Chloroflexota bacterium]